MTHQEILDALARLVSRLKTLAETAPNEAIESAILQLAGDAEQTAADAQDEYMEIW